MIGGAVRPGQVFYGGFRGAWITWESSQGDTETPLNVDS